VLHIKNNYTICFLYNSIHARNEIHMQVLTWHHKRNVAFQLKEVNIFYFLFLFVFKHTFRLTAERANQLRHRDLHVKCRKFMVVIFLPRLFLCNVSLAYTSRWKENEYHKLQNCLQANTNCLIISYCIWKYSNTIIILDVSDFFVLEYK
jgi:hypothetical protein